MALVTVNVNTEVDVDVDLDDFDDADLIEEMKKRGFAMAEPRGSTNWSPLVAIYEEFHRRGDAPDVLKNYLYDAIGRILP